MFKFLKAGLKKAVSSIGRTMKKEGRRKEKPKVKPKTGHEAKSKPGTKPKRKIKPAEKKGIFKKLRERVTTVRLSEAEFEKVFWQLQIILLENNVALPVIEKIHDDLQEKLTGKNLPRREIEIIIEKTLHKALSELLLEPFNPLEKIKKKSGPYVIVFFGVNGSGKTTSIAKLAAMLKKNDISCVFAASDTFRAASIEQLEQHANKLGIKLIKHKYGADSAAVAYDAIAHAKARKIKVVLIDTAGRMHSNVNLMREMEKICRVAKPDLKIFVGEAIIGNDAVEQAKSFNESIGINAIILTKSDIDEKGGAAVSVSHVTGKPILFLGTGQAYTDLEKFDKEKILKSLGF